MEDSKASGPDSCIICNKTNALRCQRCKSVSYCSKLCQRGDYPVHKLLCARFSAFDITTRPDKEHVRAILFPVDQKQPKLIWLHCGWIEPEDEYDRRWQNPNAKPFLNNDHGHEVIIRYNDVLGKHLSDIVCVSYRDTFLIDGSVPNNSIASVTATVPASHHDWRGPVIAYGKVGSSFDPERCRDVNMNDFRHITDYLVWYNSDRTSVPMDLPAPLAKIKGVKINCLGDQKLFNKPHFEEIDLPATDAILNDHDTSDIAKRIGLPIFTRRCFPHPNWANVRDSELFGTESPFNNQDATFLHLCCDPNVKDNVAQGVLGWGWASAPWQNSVGSTIVVRQDKKPLSRWHVEALCRYCRYDARDWMAHSMGEYAPDKPLPKSQVLSMICRPTFSICWYKMCSEKHKQGETVDAPFPYDG
ncbi:hypothetical protein ANO14919_069240 [Xylariales sp. No.14919]|nr:hypothetical protein ANO14919_041460 [Xylariales sp. No.14919]GAW17467.1 hypothetical protein ANO14919_069240 [Xylariales sp. No.14919]